MKKNMLLKPIYTEKSLKDAGSHRYTFAVKLSARKDEIKKEVEKMFDLKVNKIATITVPGKARRNGKLRREVKPASWKKVIVTVNKEITLFSAPAESKKEEKV